MHLPTLPILKTLLSKGIQSESSFLKKKVNILIYSKELLIRFDVKPYLLGMLKINREFLAGFD